MANKMTEAPLKPPTAEPARGGFMQSLDGLKNVMKDPAIRAFMLQGGLSLLNGGGWGGALADGAGAIGRYGENQKKEAKSEEEQRRWDLEYQMEREKTDAYIQKQRESGGGGGSGGRGGSGRGSGSSSLSGLSLKDVQKSLYNEALETYKAQLAEYENALDPNMTPPTKPDPLDFYDDAARAYGGLKNGMPLPLYQELRKSNPDGAREFADTWQNDPDSGRRILDEWRSAQAPVAPAQPMGQGAPAPMATPLTGATPPPMGVQPPPLPQAPTLPMPSIVPPGMDNQQFNWGF